MGFFLQNLGYAKIAMNSILDVLRDMFLAEETGAESVDTEIFPSAMKTAMRFHVRKICQTSHCVDTLVLYLNSPSKTDGTMLLWDVNKNGVVSICTTYLHSNSFVHS